MRFFVFSEENGGKPSTISLEMLTKARSFGADVAAFSVCVGSDTYFAALGAHRAAALPGLVGPGDVVFFGLTPTDRDVAGRLAARTGAAVLSNAVDVKVEGSTASVVNEIFGGNT